MKRRGFRGSDLQWLAASLALVGVIGIQALEPMDALLPSAQAASSTTTQSVGDIPAPMRQSLFMESRGVVVAQSTVESSSTGRSRNVPPIELVGTLLSGRADVALVAEGSDGARRVQIGDSVSDWRIVDIERDRLTLKQEETLEPVLLR